MDSCGGIGLNDWTPPPHDLTIEAGEVHVWRYPLDSDLAAPEKSADILSPEERDRARKFHFEIHRSRYIRAHALVRVILGLYTGCAPTRLSFAVNRYGKPSLLDAPLDLRFNTSDSDDCGLLAVALGREVGVDVERMRLDMPHIETATDFFSPSETACLRCLPAELQPIGFFHCWTRKEAYIKAKGRGLSIPLDGFDVSLEPSSPARLLRSMGEPDDQDGWTLWNVEPVAGFVGAAAVQGWGARLLAYAINQNCINSQLSV
jgi:4'-phosphopantetheinyl transferase